MSKDYIIQLRDKIALTVLPVLLKSKFHDYFEVVAECYQIADIMVSAREQKQQDNFLKFN